MQEILIEPKKNEWNKLVKRPAINSDDKYKIVLDILNAVKASGDDAVKNYSLQFDGCVIENLWVSKEEIKNSSNNVSENLKKAIDLARQNIEKFHKSQKEKKINEIHILPGVSGWRQSFPISRVGLYIPGGSAPLFSTLLMLAIPAIIAGCENISVTTPAKKDGTINAAILYVAKILGIKKIYKSGGAQAIAALAYGTQSLQKVHKIFGPGNQYVTLAKKIVSNDSVAIDMLAGPSELAVYADHKCVPKFVAADLLSQAEHGIDSQVMLVASEESVIKNVWAEIQLQLPFLERKDIIEQSLLNSRFIVFDKAVHAFDLINEYAPEHLIIASKDPLKHARYVKNAGSVFIGNMSAESAGDYASGTNHSLPTNGTALYQSGVSVDSFIKKITFQMINKIGLESIGDAVEEMAAAEGLTAHKKAIAIRRKSKL